MFPSRRKILLLSAAIIALLSIGISCLAASRWQTEITATGSVSGAGHWEVKISSASVQPGIGATVEGEEAPEEVRATVTVYDIRLKTAHRKDRYIWQIDDTSGREMRLTAAELSAYAENYSVPTDDLYYTSGKAPGTLVFFMTKYDDTLPQWKKGGRDVAENTDGGASDGLVVGKAIGKKVYQENLFENKSVIMSWNEANEALKNGKAYASKISEDGCSVSYETCRFALPGAYAVYDMTITNEGNGNANLEDYALTAALPEGFTASLPDLTGDLLGPGESCQISFVIQLNADFENFPVESAPFTVCLKYAQDEVPSAPSPTHSHN